MKEKKIEQEKLSRNEIKLSIFNFIRKDIKTAKELADKEIEKTILRREAEKQKYNKLCLKSIEKNEAIRIEKVKIPELPLNTESPREQNTIKLPDVSKNFFLLSWK